MQPLETPTIYDEQAFVAKYWHPNTEVVTVLNPTKNDYIFQATVDAAVDMKTGRPRPEQRQYQVKAGGSERFPGSIANMYLDQMSRQLAQTEERLDRMVDWTERSKYYDQLTADTEDLIASYVPNPIYAPQAVAPVTESVAEELPFAGLKQPAAASAKDKAKS
jgi:hypothetical protein